MSKRIFKIGDQRINLGETRDVYLPISETYTGDVVRLPIRVIRSKKPGPKVCITAAIHGDEINGTGIIHDFLFGDAIKLSRGTLVFVPVVNVFGFEANERYLPDRRDLNRSFPGSSGGSLASRFAHTLMKKIVANCDLAIDLHSAAAQRTNFPNIRADFSNPEIRKLAMAFGVALVIDGKGPVGSFRREATRAGCPTIILEAGEAWKVEPSVLEIGVQGIRNVLIHLGMFDGEATTPPYQAMIRKTRWLRANAGGILKFHVRPGDFVEPKQIIATNYSILGEEQNTVYSDNWGVVLGMATLPTVKPGEPICHVAILSDRQVEQYRKKLNATGADPHKRAQRHLATNVDVVEVD